MSDNREIEFAKTLESVRKLAKEQGNCVSQQQVLEAFEKLMLSEEQMQMVFDYLVKHKVGIGEPMDPDDFLSEEEKSYLEVYLKELEGLPVYTDGERHAFAISLMAGDMTYFEQMTNSFLPQVVDIAKLYSGQGVLLEDLIGEGNVALTFALGMLGSLEKAEEVPGFIARNIMNAMEEYVAENSDNEKTESMVEGKVNKIADKARELAEELHRKVTVKELAEETGISEKAIRDACRMSGYKIEDIEYAENSL